MSEISQKLTEELTNLLKNDCLGALKTGIDPTTVICVLLDNAANLACELGDEWETVSSMLRISYNRTATDYREAEAFGRMRSLVNRPIVVFESDDEGESNDMS